MSGPVLGDQTVSEPLLDAESSRRRLNFLQSARERIIASSGEESYLRSVANAEQQLADALNK